jgi:RNA polymerase sigma factor (sigma-70 family)
MAIARALAREQFTDQERAPSLDEPSKAKRFEQLFVAHLDSAYDLARWLTRDERNAEDVVQEACLRAFKFLDGFHGENARVWLLAIVRNTYYTWLRKNQFQALNVPLDEEGGDGALLEIDGGNPVDELLQQKDARRLINSALEQLAPEFREVIVLRELEDLSYKEIAAVADIPLGTVMSRLARARKLLLQHLQQARQES